MSEREDTFLIAITVVGQPSRMAARALLYEALGRMRDFNDVPLESWWDASPDAADGHDNGEAAWTYPGRGIEAQRALVNAGLAPETDQAIGPHPSVYVIRGDRGDVIGYECERCGETSDHPAVLAEVPCQDMSKWEHGHYWVSGDVLNGAGTRVVCLSDCGMTITDGVVEGEVCDECAGRPPESENSYTESEHDHGYHPEN
jgi:hypothetical protein